MEFYIENLNELPNFASKLWSLLEHNVVIFKGDLGAGKTTLIKELIKIKDKSENTSSPSYSLINEYHVNGETIIHMDLYRLEKLEEAIDIGVEEYIFSTDFVFIEWPEVIAEILPNKHHQVLINHGQNDARKVIFK